MRRYAPDSIKFGDAKPSSSVTLKSATSYARLAIAVIDPLHFNPEKIVTGSFRTVGGVVTAVDPATGEIKINELEKKRPLTIVIKQDAVLRRFPSEMGDGRFRRGAGGQVVAQRRQAADCGTGRAKHDRRVGCQQASRRPVAPVQYQRHARTVANYFDRGC